MENEIDHELIKTICKFLTEAIENASEEIDEADLESESAIISVVGKHITKRLSYMKDEGFISDFENKLDQDEYS